jgi:uncharacterized protein (DUF362 family)
VSAARGGPRLSRRGFLGRAAGVAAFPARKLLSVDDRSLVVRVVDPRVMKTKLSPDPARVRAMVDAGITALTGEKSPAKAWASLFSKNDVVALKVNTAGKARLSTSLELVAAVTDGLRLAGVPDSGIILWEKVGFLRTMRAANYPVNQNADGSFSGTRLRCGTGNNSPTLHYLHPRHKLSAVLAHEASAFINMPVAKDHDLTGYTGALKNIAMGSVHGCWRFHDKGRDCSEDIAAICALPVVRKKSRLVITDALKALYHGGPADRPAYRWHANTLLFSTDPVACDVIGWRLIEEKRREAGMKSLQEEGRFPRYIGLAAGLGLGQDEPRRIRDERISLG